MTASCRNGLSHTFFLILALSCLLSSCSFREGHKPLYRLPSSQIPELADDLDTDSLLECVRQQITWLKKQDPQKTVALDEDIYQMGWLLLSQEAFLKKLEQHPGMPELRRFLHENFIFYQAGGRKDRWGRKMLVTGYYEPVFAGNLTAEPPFLTPLYAPPPSLITWPGEEGTATRIGRLDNKGHFVDFWSRAEIETGGMLAGNELVFLKDPFDAFLLHVQGSGRIRLPDHSIRTVRFAGSNNLEYKSIGKLLVDEKKMKLEDVTVPAIRNYLEQHPEDRQRILHHNPRFTFFAWGDSQGPRGSNGIILTPGRSIAIDGAVLPQGTLGYLVSRAPTPGPEGRIESWKSLHRFVFPQDSGAAIKGAGRVDIFFGHGEYAEFAANNMKEEGKLFFLVKKGYSAPAFATSTTP